MYLIVLFIFRIKMFARMCRFQSKNERIQKLGEKAERMEVTIIVNDCIIFFEVLLFSSGI